MTRVAVLMGGWSPEREVSLVSGKACAEGLREGGHEVVEYDVKRDLRALVDFLRPAVGDGPDVVFNALHGRYGEDGCIQGVLEIMRVPYTHSGVLASAIAMDKPLARHIFASLGLRVAEGRVIERRTLACGDPMPRPYVVKPIDQGSSIGVHIVRDGDNLAAVEAAEAAFGERVLIEKFVPGRELTVAVMGDKPVAVTELRPRTRFYDYEAKYTDGITEHLVPAPIPEDVYEAAKQWAFAAYQELGCNGLARADFRWDDSKPGTSGLVILELNTQPGMTPLSLAPEQAKWAGISWSQLMTWMVEHARHPS
ncbi:MAG: D-alanine--D-alanine ligase [Reyranella sp.]|uniref:D-alanine--D-alanine ligase n=1 Tax=Reyranella sp. TaxID=1929291 RepID=UPI0011FBA4A5|nr:D-alanine--D-alanine ligase [Reyranella sp.]TAJ96634.1 MAG: D-alanine--D-alanine ligase [Reyranella sp.]TBR28210.1 MAG: D-alanine--D-alanine ligase [Reyranella sp.]